MYVLINQIGDIFRKQDSSINSFTGYLTIESAKRAKAQADTQWNGPWEITEVFKQQHVLLVKEVDFATQDRWTEASPNEYPTGYRSTEHY